MGRRRLSLLLPVAMLASSSHAYADSVDDIPASVLDDAQREAPAAQDKRAEERATFQGTFFAQAAATGYSAPQAVVVPLPSGTTYSVQLRGSFDAAFRWKPLPTISVTLSDRLSVFAEDNAAFASWDTVRNDFREGFFTWQPARNTFLEAGRINIRNGAALGFNPTDFWKTRTLVGQSSLDPSVIRQNRLGTVMVQGQSIWKGGSASIAFAPKLAEASAIDETNPNGLDPRFDATNANYRLLCTLSEDIADMSPELLGYFEEHRSKLGINLTRPIGDAIVAYAEWAGGPETNLITRALAFGKATGTLPASAPSLPQTSANTVVRNDVAAGFSWTIATKVTVNAEYHFHEAGFSRSDLVHWFNIGAHAPPALDAELWYIRAYANDQQEPLPMHEGFLRVAWPQAFTRNLELSAFGFVSLIDGSVFTQGAASYYLSDSWTVSAFGSANIGDTRTERGSFLQRVSAIAQITRYL